MKLTTNLKPSLDTSTLLKLRKKLKLIKAKSKNNGRKTTVDEREFRI